jgi:hypothetical protein
VFQTIGWVLQLLAVWAVTRAFDMGVPLPAAALVLLLMNVATIFPLWPGNVGLLQAAVALPLRQYGVAYGTGFAFGLVLQAVEMSVGVGVGLVFLAREGLSLATLKRIEEDEEVSAEDALEHLAGPHAELPQESEAASTLPTWLGKMFFRLAALLNRELVFEIIQKDCIFQVCHRVNHPYRIEHPGSKKNTLRRRFYTSANPMSSRIFNSFSRQRERVGPILPSGSVRLCAISLYAGRGSV